VPRLIDVRAPEQEKEELAACEAILLFWYMNEGDSVAAEQDLAEIETAKAVIVVKAPENGVLREVLVREGDPVEPGQKLATIERTG